MYSTYKYNVYVYMCWECLEEWWYMYIQKSFLLLLPTVPRGFHPIVVSLSVYPVGYRITLWVFLQDNLAAVLLDNHGNTAESL